MLTSPIGKTTRFLRLLRYAHALLRGVVLLFVVLVLVTAYFFTFFRVQGESMLPTLQNHQVLPIFLAQYWFRPPLRGDVVIVEYAGDRNIRFVKRIVGVPGDTVQYLDQPLTLADDQYFVEGDNRDHSTDSRSYGPISRPQILGRVLGAKPFKE